MLLDRALFGVALLAAGAHAATSSSSSTSSSTASSTSTAADGPTTIKVTVGKVNHVITPENITANAGDVIQFEFFPNNHSIIQAAFGYPCIPYEYVTGQEGFYSAPQSVNSLTDTTFYSITINDTNPIFVYCGAPGSCLDWGMMASINQNETQSQAAQKAAREEYPLVLTPGEPWPSENNPLSTVTGLAVTATATAKSSSSSSSSSNDDSDHSHHSTLSAGQIAGIAIGGAALLLLGGALVYFCGRRGGVEKGYRKSGMLTRGNAVPATEPQYESPDMSKHYSSQYGLGVQHTGTSASIMSPGLSPGGPGYGYVSPGMANMPLMHGQDHHYQPAMSSPLHQAPAPVPVELPASADPGNSPLPQYTHPLAHPPAASEAVEKS